MTTDKLDARKLGMLAVILEPKAKAPPSEVLQKLQEIVRARAAFVAQRTAHLNQLEAARTASLKQQIRHPIKRLSPPLQA